MLLYSDSRKPHPDVDGSLKQVCHMTWQQLVSILENGNACAATFVDTKNRIQSLYHPQLKKDLTNENVTSIVGNVSNTQGEFGLMEIEFNKAGFPVIMEKADIPVPEFYCKDKLPGEVLTGTKWDGKEVYAFLVPRVIPTYFGGVLGGQLNNEDTSDKAAALGAGYAFWEQAASSHALDEKEILQVIGKDPVKANWDKYIANKEPSSSPCMLTSECFPLVDSTSCPNQAHEIKKWFVAHAISPSQTHQLGSAVSPMTSRLVLQDDIDKNKAAEMAINKMKLLLIGGQVNFETCKITNLHRPILTRGLEEVLAASRTQRGQGLQELLENQFRDTREKGTVTDVQSNASMFVFSSVFVTMLLNGNVAAKTLTSLQTGEFNALNILHFLPQKKEDNAVIAALRSEQDKKNSAAANHASKEEKQVLAILGEMIDYTSIVGATVNVQTVMRTIVDIVDMIGKGAPCILVTFMKEIMDWVLREQRTLDEWKSNVGEMPHLNHVYLAMIDNIVSKFGCFARITMNRTILSSAEADLSTLNLEQIESALVAFKAQREQMRTLRITNAKHIHPPTIYRAYQQLTPQDHGGKSPAMPKTDSQPPAKKSRTSYDKQPVGTTGGGNDTAAPSGGRSTSKFHGIIHLHDGKRPQDAIPSGLKTVCPYFVARGWNCTAGCHRDKHPTNMGEMSRRDAVCILDHLVKSGAGYANKHRCNAHLSPAILKKYASVIGDSESPPATQVVEDTEVRVQEQGASSVEDSFEMKLYLDTLDNPHRRSRLNPLNNLIPQPKMQCNKQSSPSPRIQLDSAFNVPAPVVENRQHIPPALDEPAPQKPFRQLVRGKKHKETLLLGHKEKYGSQFTDSVVTESQGKQILYRPYSSLPNQRALVSSTPIKPRQTAYYRAETPTFQLCLLPLIASGCLDMFDYGSLSQIDMQTSRLVKIHLRLLDVDVTPLLLPRLDFEKQQQLQEQRIDMATALFIHYGGDPGKLVRAMNHEYVLANLDRQAILKNVKEIASPEDYAHISRILLEGCPAEFGFDEPNHSRLKWFDRGNQPSYVNNPVAAKKTLNKEDKKSHIIPIYEEVARYSPYCRHTPQGMVIKQGANPRVVWDGSTKYSEDDVVMNEVSSTELEAPIDFGKVEPEFDAYLYNLRVSYPSSNILLAMVDISSCFRFGRIPPDLTGAFGFSAGDGIYCLANAMVFGHIASANSWEPFRRTIEALTVVLANSPDTAEKLVKKHRKYLDMIQWDDTPSDEYVKAKACPLCPGVFRSDGEVPAKTRFYVDDGLLAAINKRRMEILLAATIEAIFLVMGDPDPRLRTCPLSLDKWVKLVASAYQIALGLAYDTVALTKGTTDEYRSNLLLMLDERWPKERCYFVAKDAQTLVGKLARLAKGARWVFHILSHMYDQIALALASNRALLAVSSPRFRAYTQRIRQNQMGRDKLSKDGARIIAFALKKSAQLVHGYKQRYRITPQMREDIEFFRAALQPSSTIKWHIPLAHVVSRTPLARLFGDACLLSAGGYSFGMKFWWHIGFPPEIVALTLLHISDDSDDSLISINALEFVTVILNYCAALTVLEDEQFTDDPYPVVLAITDNTSALNWTNHACKRSRLGKTLARFFVGLLLDSPLGINAEWISTEENKIADDISQIPNVGTLSFLGPVAAASLSDLENVVIQEIARSKSGAKVETERSRQAHYIAWCHSMNIPDAIGNDPRYQLMAACYLKDVMSGNNYYGRPEVRSDTIRGYAEAVNVLFERQFIPPPIQFSDPANPGAILITNLAAEEVIAKQRAPLNNAIMNALLVMADNTHRNSPENAVANIFAIGRYLGFRVSEYAQTTQNKVDYHVYPSGHKELKAFRLTDWIFLAPNGDRVNIAGLTRTPLQSIYEQIVWLKVTWRIQKNRRNGQSVKLCKDAAHERVCPVMHALIIVLRKFRIDRDNLDMPLCMCSKTEVSPAFYLTGKKVAEVLQRAVKKVQPGISKSDLSRYTAHSLRVWAAVLLDQQGKSPTFIKSRLRWLGDSYQLYLRDTPRMNQLHRDALSADSQEIIDLVSNDNPGVEDTTLDYQDDMD